MGLIDAYKMAKNSMPKYMFRFTYTYTWVMFLSCALVMIGGGIGCSILSERHPEIEMLPMAIAGEISVVIVACFLLKAHLVYKKYAIETATFFETEYTNISLEIAEQQLKEEKVLDDTGFLYVVRNDMQETEVGKVPFENCKLYFQAFYWVGVVHLTVHVLDYNEEKTFVAYKFSPQLFCYLREKGFTFVNQPTFSLFDRDKTKFVRLLLRCQNGDVPYINRIDREAKKYTD